MKSELSKYIKYFKETDEDLKIKTQLLGTAGLNNFIIYNSSPRGLMMSSHIAQTLVLENPDSKIIKSGLEDELKNHALTISVNADIEVINLIKRYEKGPTIEHINKVVEYTLIYKEIETGEIDAIVIPKFRRNHPYFGFIYNINTDLLESLSRGDIIEKGTLLAWPNTYDLEKDEYGFGKNLNVALMSIDGVGEDGMIVSKSCLEKLKFSLIENRNSSAGDNSFFLNLYGDDEVYKPFPEIDEEINDSGAFCATRKYDKFLAPALYSKKDVKDFNPIFDNVTYVRGKGGKVIDLKVLKSPRKKKMLPKHTDVLLEKYSNALLNYYREIINTYNSLNSNRIGKKDLIVGNTFTNLIVEAMNVVESSYEKAKVKKLYRKEDLDLYRVEADIQYVITPTKGFKITDLHGGKGVIVQVWDDEDMPVDADGNRADVIMDPSATVSRLNIGRLYERYISAASRKAKKIVVDELKKILDKENITRDDIMNMSDKDVKKVFKTVLEFVKIFENEQYDVYSKATIDEMKEVLVEILEQEFYVYMTVENEKRAYEIVMDIENTRFKPIYGPVKYRQNGKEIVTKDNVFIAPMHIILLNKIADGLLSCSSAKINHFGMPIGVSKADKYKIPWRNTPVRFISETEGRLYAAYGGREFLAEMTDRAVSLNTHRMMYSNILKNPKPLAINEVIDREKQPFGEHKALEILETLFNSVGLNISFEEDTRRYINPDEMEDVITTVLEINDVEIEDSEIDDEEE